MLPLENDGVMNFFFFLHYKDCIVQSNIYQFENQSVIVQSLVYWLVIYSLVRSHNLHFSSAGVQFISVSQSCQTLCDPMNCSTPGLPEFTQTHVHWVGDVIQPSHPLSSPFPPAPIRPSIRVLSNESTLCMRWPKYWSFSFSIIPSKEHPGLISFRMDWLDFLAVQGTLKSLLQHHSSKASILRAFENCCIPVCTQGTTDLNHWYYLICM